MARIIRSLAVLLFAGLTAGCVERRYVVVSDPPGALVQESGRPLGATPADGAFVYYGKYRFTLVRDGYETLIVDQDIPAPWYEYIGLDFFSENVVPWTIRDVRRFEYHLQPLQTPNENAIIQRGEELRQRGQAIRPAAAPPPPAPAAGTPPPPPSNTMPPAAP
jgi:hypothetical protein